MERMAVANLASIARWTNKELQLLRCACIGSVRARADLAAALKAADVDRLALRMRLGSNWRDVVGPASTGVSVAREVLVANSRLQTNAQQAAAAEALDQLPGTLEKARDAHRNWDEQQKKLTVQAKAAAESVRQERKDAAEWRKGGWISRTPALPSVPSVVGPVCWLSLGPPPVLNPAGCYLYGSVGSGKSTLMDLFCLFGCHSWTVRRQHFHEFALWLHQSLRSLAGAAPGAPNSHVLARVADDVASSTDILCLDEFALTNVADAAIFAELFRHLSERHVAVICTTNRPPQDLYKDGLHRERYLPAMVAHIQSKFLIATVEGTDYRHKLLQDEIRIAHESIDSHPPGVLFQGGSADAALQIALKSDESGFPLLAPGEVKVAWGRSLQVPKQGSGVACFHFDDLCRRALSAEDYLHLALQYHTVFIHDVPRLSLDEHNEARRFTNFIDALYEHSVRLVCHSAVPIDDVLVSVEALREVAADGSHTADSLGVFETMYDDSPNFQIQIKELGSREKWQELQDRRIAEEQRVEAQRLARLSAPLAAEGDSGSGWSSAPATADLSAPDQGVAGVMVAAVGSLQESGFAAQRAKSRLMEMQTAQYLEAAQYRRRAMTSQA